ncbi:hypothetical protein EGN72_02470 [Pseudorhodobacter sp. E13]|uniref:hypothetical protein n=1 Tax=Pseudorhodobacter sp. E13 TaxID=2487931 RepID=UPI000F8CC3C4|nr:hypothetical protein [Pseudorhodobacter sp. E13]RUS64875.1 hypothetical protein EGN72_02470 [Pseudorhodobacter sp. E13]
MAKQPKPTEAAPETVPASETGKTLSVTGESEDGVKLSDAINADLQKGGAGRTEEKPEGAISERRVATATRLIEHNGEPIEAEGDIVLSEAEFKALAAVGAVAEKHWHDLQDA